MASSEEMLRTAQDNYDYVRFTVCDIHGISRSKTVPAASFPKFFTQGTELFIGYLTFGTNSGIIDFSLLPEIEKAGCGNCDAKAMPGTLHALGWSNSKKARVGQVLCESFYTDGRPQDMCPRYMARRQLQQLEQVGYQLFSSFESEFCVIHRDTNIPIVPAQSVYCGLAFAEVEDMLYEIDTKLRRAGVEVETLQTEYAAGQLELVMRPEYGLKGAENTFLLRDCTKHIARQHGYDATFMTKPVRSDPLNSGAHFNHSLVQVGMTDNAFADAEGEHGMAAVMEHWVAGLVAHLPALCALCCPTINCYRRVHQAWACEKADWDVDSRYVTLRVKNYSAKRTYIESRLPGAAANPYLVLASHVAAGLDGVRRKLPRPPPHDPAAVSLPRTLGEALQCLQDDKVICDALGEQFISWFVQMKTGLEVDTLKDWQETRDTEETFQKEKDLYYSYI